jgi:hypothetical protein
MQLVSACKKAAVLVVLTCAACAPERAQPGSIADIVQASAHGLEVEATPQDQAREEVLSMPTEFEVSLEQDRYAWERARFFLENYSGTEGEPHNAVVKVVGSRRGLGSAPSTSTEYAYEVFKDFYAGGYRYSVQCVAGPSGQSQQAALNAGNLARFIRDGKLEVSLLPGREG